MSTSDIYDNFCEVEEIDLQEADDELVEKPKFIVEIDASLTFPPVHFDELHDGEEDVDEFSIDFKSVSLEKTVSVELEQLLKDPESFFRTTITESMQVPVEDYMIPMIAKRASNMAKSDKYKNRNVLRMHVNLDILLDGPPSWIHKDEGDDDAP